MPRPGEEEEGIRVYLRIRPPPTAQQSRLLAANDHQLHSTALSTASSAAPARLNAGSNICQYEVEEDFEKSILHLHTSHRLVHDAQRSAAAAATTPNGTEPAVPEDVVNNTVVDFRYRFDRVFRPEATQADVFNTVAKDCVRSVLDGLNSTVFAYGQTGSGKTYSITGGTESYQDRGLIPRAMAMIFEEVARRRDDAGEHGATTYTLMISYLQIYNDRGQDLLNHGHDARTLEELPPVSIHEMEDEILLKGLEQHSATTLSDALNLLFLGDTNRLYCETPMNKTSSRSHCIFTVYIEARSSASSTVRRSKLNLVDLAGSERVIVALSEKAKGVRDHIPYRNSFLTMALRDSLGRNCSTAMLATAHVVASQVAETISTCAFAQRVALIRQAPHVNVETDPVLLVKKLKAEVAQLKDEVALLRAHGSDEDPNGSRLAADRTLSDDEKGVCRCLVDAYVQKAAVDGDWSSKLTGFAGDMARMYYCYDVLRERLIRASGRAGGGMVGLKSSGTNNKHSSSARGGNSGDNDDGDDDSAIVKQLQQQLEESEAQVAALRQSLQLKENELQMLLTVLKRAGGGGHGGYSGGGGGGGVRYSALTQASGGPSSVSSFHSNAADAAGLLFSTGVASGAPELAEEEAVVRRAVYHAAQQLIHQLRQSARSNLAPHAKGQDVADPALPAWTHPTSSANGSDTNTFVSTHAAEAALTRITTLAQQGQLSDAEATVATQFLESKKGLHLPQQQQRRRSSADPPQPQDDADTKSTDNDGSGDVRTAVDVLMDEQLVQDRAQALEAFKASYDAQHKVEETKQLLKPRYAACKATAQSLNSCVDTIKRLKTNIQRRRAERAADGSDVVDGDEASWLEQLRAAKEAYNGYASQLRQDKEEIEGMHAYLKHAQEQLVRDFERWFSARQQQVQLAVQQQQRHAKTVHESTSQTQLTNSLRGALRLGENGPVKPAETHRATYEATNLIPGDDAVSAGATTGPKERPAGGFQALSAPLSSPSLGRAYPSSAPAPAAAAAMASVSLQSSPYTDTTAHLAYDAAQRAPAVSDLLPTATLALRFSDAAPENGILPSSTPIPALPEAPPSTGATTPANVSGADPASDAASARALNRVASLPSRMPAEPSSPSPGHHVALPYATGSAGAASASISSGLARSTEHLFTASTGAAAVTGTATRTTGNMLFSGGSVRPSRADGWLSGSPNTAGLTPPPPHHLSAVPSVTPHTAGAGSGAAGAVHSSPSSARPFHLQPLSGGSSLDRVGNAAYPTDAIELAQTAAAAASSLSPPPQAFATASSSGGSGGGSNPFFPQFPSTGNAAADEQLAQLYKAREAMRRQLQP